MEKVKLASPGSSCRGVRQGMWSAEQHAFVPHEARFLNIPMNNTGAAKWLRLGWGIRIDYSMRL